MGLIFDPFYRGTKTKHVDGTGLGLAIAKRIAESHGGRISVKSQVGKGTTVEVYLPAGGQE
jgi:signal transduction histidine kinase